MPELAKMRAGHSKRPDALVSGDRPRRRSIFRKVFVFNKLSVD